MSRKFFPPKGRKRKIESVSLVLLFLMVLVRALVRGSELSANRILDESQTGLADLMQLYEPTFMW